MVVPPPIYSIFVKSTTTPHKYFHKLHIFHIFTISQIKSTYQTHILSLQEIKTIYKSTPQLIKVVLSQAKHLFQPHNNGIPPSPPNPHPTPPHPHLVPLYKKYSRPASTPKKSMGSICVNQHSLCQWPHPNATLWIPTPT